MTSKKPKPLTHKQQLFVDEYLKCWNAAEAARRAGYPEKSAYNIGWQNVRKLEISEAIKARLDEVHVSADEALKLNADIARGDIAEVMDISSVGFNLDMQAAQEKGMTRLIKKVKQKTTTYLAKSKSGEDREVTELEIELYPADAAIERAMRVHGLFKDPGTKENPLHIDGLEQYLDKIYGSRNPKS